MGKSFSSLYGQSAPSNKIKVGLIGCRNQGWSDLKTFLQYPGVECISLCDVDDQWLYQRAEEYETLKGKKPAQLVKDWRKVIDNKDVDMVIVGTPIDLTRVIKIRKPYQRVRYELQEIGQPTLEDILKKKFGKKK
jgi:hypothetical protein